MGCSLAECGGGSGLGQRGVAGPGRVLGIADLRCGNESPAGRKDVEDSKLSASERKSRLGYSSSKPLNLSCQDAASFRWSCLYTTPRKTANTSNTALLQLKPEVQK